MQPQNCRRLRVPALLLCALLAADASWAQDPKVVEELENEAAQCAALVSTEPLASDALVADARKALQGIRSIVPELAGVRFSFPAKPGEMLITVGWALRRRIRDHAGEASAFDFEDKVLNDVRDRYRLRSLDATSENYVRLIFKEPSGRVNLLLLLHELEKSPAVSGVMRNLYFGEPEYALSPCKEGRDWLLAVERGRPSGGIRPRVVGADSVEVWYFRVAEGKAELVESLKASDLKTPRVDRWGVPGRIFASVHPSVDKLLETAKGHAEWWHRTHALYSAGRLLRYAGPGVAEDDARKYALLRDAALVRREEILDLLIERLSDADGRIREAARGSLGLVFDRDAGQDPKAWRKLRKGGD